LNINKSEFHSSNKSSYNISLNFLNNKKSCCNQPPISKFPKSNKSFIKLVKISKSDSLGNNTSKTIIINSFTSNKLFLFQNSEPLNKNLFKFVKGRVNSLYSVINSNLKFYENPIYINQKFSLTIPSNQIININHLFKIKTNNINHLLYFIIQNINI